MLTIPVFRFMTSQNRPLRFLIEDYDDVYDASRLSQWVDHDRQLSIVASKQNETFTWLTCHSRFSIRRLLVVSWEHTCLWTVVSESHVIKIQNVKPSDGFAHWYAWSEIYVSTSLRPTDWNLKMNVRIMNLINIRQMLSVVAMDQNQMSRKYHILWKYSL